MPDTPQGASAFFNRKKNLPSELRYAEAQNLSSYVKERAFFMASVTNADILQANRTAINKVLSGQLSKAQARDVLSDIYKEKDLPVQPLPGLEGTIKDLRTSKRMAATIQRGVDDARGWERHRQLSGDPAHPGFALVRRGRAKEPRDWKSKWVALAANYKDAHPTRMVALASSGIWTALSVFGRPSPPFDWGSHMTLQPVSLKGCVDLGLLPDPKTPEGRDELKKSVTQSQQSLNHSVQKSVKGWDETVKDDVLRRLDGIADYDEATKTIRMVDINGTRPYDWDKIGSIIDPDKNPAGVKLTQKQLWEEWIADSGKLQRSASLNKKENLARALMRINPVNSETWGKTIYRTLACKDEKDYNEMIARLKEGEFKSLPGRVAESWTDNTAMIDRYKGSKYSVTIACDEYYSVRPMHGLYNRLTENKKIGNTGLNVERELLMPSDATISVNLAKTKKLPNGGFHTFYQGKEKRQ